MMLSFELCPSGDQIEIHADAEGIAFLVKTLQRVSATRQHDHLIAPEWGGQELTSELQKPDNESIKKVTVVVWRDR